MTPRSLANRLLSPAGFGLALLLFLLPFVTVSCDATADEVPYTVEYAFTGLDLVTGGSPEISGVVPDDDGSPMTVSGASDDGLFAEQVGRPVQPLAVAAALALVAGLAAGLVLPVALRGRVSGALALAAVTLLVVEVLAVAPARAAEELTEAFPDDPTLATHTTPAIGFYLTLVVLLALLVREVIAARRSPTTTTPADSTGPPAQVT
ncbi:MAG: hypothetical protein IRY85_09895 [Micromonosporaceae bacterium]|nr:hypothetical protein [Micromonosporaceae bacterium]